MNIDLSQHINKSEAIQKGFYLSSNLTFNKKGSEIKTQLEKIKRAKENLSVSMEAQKELLKNEIGEEPTQQAGSEKYPYLRYEMGNCDWNCLSQTEMMKNKYNSLNYRCEENYDSIEQIETLLNLFEDSKVYPLSLNDAQTLGF